jgi:hypothetical protein
VAGGGGKATLSHPRLVVEGLSKHATVGCAARASGALSIANGIAIRCAPHQTRIQPVINVAWNRDCQRGAY